MAQILIHHLLCQWDLSTPHLHEMSLYLNSGLGNKLYVHYIHGKSLWPYHVASQHRNWWIHSVSCMDNTRILTRGKDILETRCTYSLYYTQTFKKRKSDEEKWDKWSKSLKPLKKHYVQRVESWSGRCGTELLFLNKIKRETSLNNTDNRGWKERSCSDGQKW